MIIDKYSIFIFLAISIYLYVAYKNSNIGLSYYDHNLNNSALDEEKDEILVEVLNQFNIKPSSNLKDTDFLLAAPEQNIDINNVKGFGTSSFNKTMGLYTLKLVTVLSAQNHYNHITKISPRYHFVNKMLQLSKIMLVSAY